MADSSNPWADLVVAMLSVNSFPLERTYQCFDGLEAEGLFLPEKLGEWDEAEVARRLGSAGYDRGPTMTAIFSERLVALGRYATENGIQECERRLKDDPPERVSDFLRPIHGVGEVVVRNFLALRGLD